eukprot:Rhum_TRINITY_DN14638_c15_g2::Rhum_TRINITY_DN14638_c15_g2_i1::g.105557::m.105557
MRLPMLLLAAAAAAGQGTEWGLHSVLVWDIPSLREGCSDVAEMAQEGIRVDITRLGSTNNTLTLARGSDVVSVAVSGGASNRHGLAWALGEQSMASLVRFEYVDADTARVVVGPVPGYALEEPETVRVSLNAARVTAQRSAALVSLWSKEGAVERDIEVRVRPTPDAVRDALPDVEVGATEVQLLSLPLSGSAAAEVQQLKLYYSLSCSEHAESTLGMSYHPLGFIPEVSSPGGQECLGAVLCNLFFVALILVIHYVLTVAAARRLNTIEAQGRMLFPSLPLFVFTFLYPGQVLCATRLVQSPAEPWHVAVGVAGLLISVVVPAGAAFSIARATKKTYATRYRADDVVVVLQDRGYKVRWPSAVVSLLFGAGEWVNSTPQLFSGRYFIQMRPFDNRYPWWSAVDHAGMFVVGVGLAQSKQTFHSCGVSRTVCAAASIVHLLLVVRFRPYCRGRDNVLQVLRLLLLSAGLIALSAAYFQGDPRHGGIRLGSHLLIASLVTILVKIVLDGLCFLVTGLCLKRRSTLQKLEWSDADSQCSELSVAYQLEPESLPASRAGSHLTAASAKGVENTNGGGGGGSKAIGGRCAGGVGGGGGVGGSSGRLRRRGRCLRFGGGGGGGGGGDRCVSRLRRHGDRRVGGGCRALGRHGGHLQRGGGGGGGGGVRGGDVGGGGGGDGVCGGPAGGRLGLSSLLVVPSHRMGGGMCQQGRFNEVQIL